MNLLELCATLTLDISAYESALNKAAGVTQNLTRLLGSGLAAAAASGENAFRRATDSIATFSRLTDSAGRDAAGAFGDITLKLQPAVTAFRTLAVEFQTIGTAMKTAGDTASRGVGTLVASVQSGQTGLQPMMALLNRCATDAQGLAAALPQTAASLTAMGAAVQTAGTQLSALTTVFPPVQSGLTALGADWSDSMTAMQTATTGLTGYLAGVPGTVSGIWSGVVSTTGAAAANVQAVFAQLQTQAAQTMAAISAATESGMNASDRSVRTSLSAIAGAFTQRLGEARTTAEQVFEAIRGGVAGKMNAADSAVGTAIAAIRSKFNFTWSLPALKLPHVSVSGSFSLSPPSVPRFSVSWYRKAMDNAMLLSSPTIFGAMNGKLLGAGEAGTEVVSGADTLMAMIRQASSGDSGEVLSLLRRILAAVEESAAPVTLSVDGTAMADALLDPLLRRARAAGTPLTA